MPQVPGNGCAGAAGQQPHQHRHSRHQQRERQHLAAGFEQTAQLNRARNALGLVFQPHKLHGLALQIVFHRRVNQAAVGGGLQRGGQPVRRCGANHRGSGVQVGRLRCVGGVAVNGGSRQIQDHIGGGEGVFRQRNGGIPAQSTGTVFSQIAPLQQKNSQRGQRLAARLLRLNVAGLHQRGGIFVHQFQQCVQCFGAHRLRNGGFHTALGNAHVHDAAGVGGQSQIALGLYHQQQRCEQADFPVAGQLPENIFHRQGSSFSISRSRSGCAGRLRRGAASARAVSSRLASFSSARPCSAPRCCHTVRR